MPPTRMAGHRPSGFVRELINKNREKPPCRTSDRRPDSRLKAPDLDVMEEFLLRFGMTRSARAADPLYMYAAPIGASPPHHGEGQAEIRRALLVARRARTISSASPRRRAPPTVRLDEPGGGVADAAHRAERLSDRGMHQASQVHGNPVKRQPLNCGPSRWRSRRLMRLPERALQVRPGADPSRDDDAEIRGDRRLVPQHARLHLFRRCLSGRTGQPDRLVQPSTAATPSHVDHHVVALAARENRRRSHLVEVQDIDDVAMESSSHLAELGESQPCGHAPPVRLRLRLLGPSSLAAGSRHSADGDRLTSAAGPFVSADEALMSRSG